MPTQGIGSNLEGAAAALWLAGSLGRTLVLDWRRSAFLQDETLNYFREFFEPLPVIRGVATRYAGVDVDDWRSADPSDVLVTSVKPERRHIPAQPPRFLVIEGAAPFAFVDPAGDEAEHDAIRRDLFAALVPRPEVAEPLERWHAEHLAGHFVVAVNASSGNGSPRHRAYVDMRIFDRERTLLRRVERARRQLVRTLPRDRRTDARVFVATDSEPLQRLLCELPNAVSRRTLFPPPGAGRHFNDYARFGASDRAGVRDTLADMLLLARCDALIRNRSRFSDYATVMTRGFGGRLVEIESLFPRSRLARPLQRARVRASQAKRLVRSLLPHHPTATAG